jgi:CO/xanthine dehydrogenase Mo-binding subunit
VLERLVDAACEELGMDPIEIRRRNFIRPDAFPYIMPTGNMYDSGNYEAVLDKALEMIDLDGWRKKQDEAREEGRYIGIGVVSCQERSVFSATEFWMWNPNETPGFTLSSSPESVAVNIDPTGKAFITLNAPFWGNSPETMAVQVLAEKLEMDPGDISVGYADSDKGFNSSGPGGSRFTVMIAGAVSGAADVIKEKMLRVASHMLEADPSDLEFRGGKIGVQGVPGKEKTIAEVALHAHYFRLSMPEDHDLTSGVDASYVYDHPVTTLPSEDRTDLGIFYPIMGNMCHIPVVEVDIETGKISFLDYVAVHDCGTMVNPMTLAGHVRGGTVNGIGSAIYEHFHYDESGQLVNALLTDYQHPTPMETPADIRVGHIETPSPFTEYGIKGGGEGGRMGAPPAIAAAVEDALRPLGVKVDSLPLTPKTLRGMIRDAEQQAT